MDWGNSSHAGSKWEIVRCDRAETTFGPNSATSTVVPHLAHTRLTGPDAAKFAPSWVACGMGERVDSTERTDLHFIIDAESGNMSGQTFFGRSPPATEDGWTSDLLEAGGSPARRRKEATPSTPTVANPCVVTAELTCQESKASLGPGRTLQATQSDRTENQRPNKERETQEEEEEEEEEK
ncbi:hypothetical protein VTO42DRAFT_2224 [Malbranchea cinnamomea]